MALSDKFKKESDMNYGDTPNVVNLNLPSDRSRDGAAWVYLPSKDTIYIGPQGSYHVDIASSLKTLVDKQRNEKPVTGVLYNDGYADYFDKADKKTTDRIILALQAYHSENYGRSFNDAEDDAGTWDDSGGHYLYPQDSDYEDADEDEDDKGTSGLDSYTYTPTDFDSRAWGNGEYKEMKPTPGMEHKPIGDWDVQDYLDWRDKKHWNPSGYFATPREDYPHFRWSYGDSKIMQGNPHEGLWVWPTHNGYPDHFSQTGQGGLGNCAQGRIYPHTGDRWEILTWPGRPRNAPSQAVREYIQKEAEEAVKQYVMEKMGVPEDKIFFTNMHYTSAVTMYNSPSYPDEDKAYNYNTNYVSKPYHYNWEPLDSWNSIPEGSWNLLKDPSGREWQRSSLEASQPGFIKLYSVDNQQPSHYEIDPSKDYTAGWEIGSKVFDTDETKSNGGNENPYDWHPSDTTNPNESITEFYNRIQQEKSRKTQPLGQPGDKQTGPPAGALKNPSIYHKNPDGTYSRLTQLKTKGNVRFDWDGIKWTWTQLTPEETYETRVRWFAEDEQARRDTAQTIFPEAFAPADTDTGDELDENGELKPQAGVHYDPKLELLGIPNENGGKSYVSVTPEDYELTYRLHGENWWKSFVPNRNLGSAADLWNEVI